MPSPAAPAATGTNSVSSALNGRPSVKRRTGVVDLAGRILAIITVGGLVWLANIAEPIQLASIVPGLTSSTYIGLLAVTTAGHVDHGSVPLQIAGTLNASADFVAVVELDTRPSGESRWQQQPACCTILDASFTGSADLRVASARTFEFQLVSGGDQTVLAAGVVAVQLESYPGGSQQAVNIIGGLGGGLGLITVLPQIWGSLPRRRSAPESAPLTRKGESDAQE